MMGICSGKQRIYKWILGTAVVVLFFIMAMFPSRADGTVSSIRLVFTNQYEEDTVCEPDITSRTAGVDVEEVKWSRKVENWQPGSKVTGTLILTSDKEFLSSYGSKTLKIDGSNVSFSSAKAKSDGTLEVKVTYHPVAQLGYTEEAGWGNEEHTIASWKRVKYATGYHLRLYRDDRLVQTLTVTGTRKDLKEYMKTAGYYYYEISATGKDANDRKYRKDGEYILSGNRIVEEDELGDTDGRWLNYAEGKRYQSEDGTNPANQWKLIDSDWYYFDENGYMVTGWRQVGGIWYYMGTNGVMLTGWQQVNGIWYYLNDNGSMATGWKETAPGSWYYLNADGSMAVDTVVDGWQLDASGLRVN